MVEMYQERTFIPNGDIPYLVSTISDQTDYVMILSHIPRHMGSLLDVFPIRPGNITSPN